MKRFLILLVLLLSLSSCNREKNDEKLYTLFTLNSHDWNLWQNSAATLNRVIDIHEKYNVPLDIYLSDPLLQVYLKQAPELVERLKKSKLIIVSYHIRPPSPYEFNFDWLGLGKMSDEEMRKTLLNYEEHEIDLTSGMPTENPGGYELLKKVMGYAPPIVGMETSGKIEKVLVKILTEKGAQYQVVHGKESEIGTEHFGMKIRPENIEIKLYESAASSMPAGEIIESRISDYLKTAQAKNKIFMNIKFHETDFYVKSPPWSYVYNDEHLNPPFDLSLVSKAQVKPDFIQERVWKLYEAAVKYVSENREKFNPINAGDLNDLLN